MRSLILALLLLTGCSAMQVAGAAKELIGGGQSGGKSLKVDSEITVGDKAEDNHTAVQLGNNTTNHQQAENIRNDTVNNHLPVWLVIFAMIGWIMPTPSDMASWVVGRFTWRRK